jgi:TetR/AcrR family transcriptional repressor of nem operon
MRYGTEHKSQTRDKILRIAARELRAKGPAHVAVADVMAGAGLSHGGFYAHFDSKADMIAAAVEVMFGDKPESSQLLDSALAESDSGTDVVAALRAFLEGYLSRAHRDGAPTGCPLPTLAGEMARQDGAAQAHYAQGLTQVTERIEAALGRMGVSQPASTARGVIAQIVGALALARATGTSAQSDAILRDNLQSLKERLGL